MADSEFEEFRRVFDRLPGNVKTPSPFYSLLPNVRLDDESPTKEIKTCNDNPYPRDSHNAFEESLINEIEETPSISENHGKKESHNGTQARRRRKLPEIPTVKKSLMQNEQPVSLAEELSDITRPYKRPASRGILVLKCGYMLDDELSPDSDKLQSVGDVDSGHSTAHSPAEPGLKSLSPSALQPYVSPITSNNINECQHFHDNTINSLHSHLEILEATHRGLYKFNPRHNDEIEIEIGDPIYVQKEAEDLWCEGVNLRTGKQGVFPSAYAVDMEYNDFDPTNIKSKRERYLLGYMGSVETLAHKGTSVVCQAVNKILNGCENSLRVQPCILEVSDQGLRMVDKSKSGISQSRNVPCIDYFYSLKNVSFCAFHPRDHRYLGFITKHPTLQRFACHVFKGQDSTRPVAESVGRAFQRFYQKFIETAYPIEDIYIE